jgi:hypothetical protein
MAQKMAGYGRKWKKWLAIYAGFAVVAYLILYLLLFHGGASAGGGGFHY